MMFPRRDIGWEEIGEEFTRWTLLWTPWFAVYLHRLHAPNAHPQCHDHPWWFVTLILKSGYNEYHNGRWVWRKPWTVLYRPANFSHNVVTKKPAWSIILTGPKNREWSLHDCRIFY